MRGLILGRLRRSGRTRPVVRLATCVICMRWCIMCVCDGDGGGDGDGELERRRRLLN